MANLVSQAKAPGYPSEIVAAAIELAGLGIGSRVVEVGSGTGKLTEELVACGLRIDAVDPGLNMVEFARRRVKESDLVRFHIVRPTGDRANSRRVVGDLRDDREVPPSHAPVLEAESERIINRHGGTLRSTQLVTAQRR